MDYVEGESSMQKKHELSTCSDVDEDVGKGMVIGGNAKNKPNENQLSFRGFKTKSQPREGESFGYKNNTKHCKQILLIKPTID